MPDAHNASEKNSVSMTPPSQGSSIPANSLVAVKVDKVEVMHLRADPETAIKPGVGGTKPGHTSVIGTGKTSISNREIVFNTAVEGAMRSRALAASWDTDKDGKPDSDNYKNRTVFIGHHSKYLTIDFNLIESDEKEQKTNKKTLKALELIGQGAALAPVVGTIISSIFSVLTSIIKLTDTSKNHRELSWKGSLGAGLDVPFKQGQYILVRKDDGKNGIKIAFSISKVKKAAKKKARVILTKIEAEGPTAIKGKEVVINTSFGDGAVKKEFDYKIVLNSNEAHSDALASTIVYDGPVDGCLAFSAGATATKKDFSKEWEKAKEVSGKTSDLAGAVIADGDSKATFKLGSGIAATLHSTIALALSEKDVYSATRSGFVAFEPSDYEGATDSVDFSILRFNSTKAAVLSLNSDNGLKVKLFLKYVTM